MTVQGGGGAQNPIELDAMLLAAKAAVPEGRPGDVSRAELIATARSAECRAVGFTAPAGYGKSTLLAEWARLEDRPVAWVSLDRYDDDPGVLVSLLASAYTQISPDHPDLVADVTGVGLSALGRAAPRLAAAFGTAHEPFVLMMDDLHELQSPDCHDVLGVVINGIPRGSQFVTASRSEQPHLPRLRASADAVEFGTGDLALEWAGAQQIFAGAQVSLTPDLAVAVTERTEGWPAGLYLAALIASNAGGEALSVAGDDRYVADYLYREALSRLPEHTQQFLRRTSVLDRLSAPLCDAILESTTSHQELHELERSNLFLVPLDRRRGWYRYHGLFREFLLGELRRQEPDAIMKLHLRAADWYEVNGSPAMAIEHLLNTTERDRCVQLVTQLILPTYQAGQMSTVERWIGALGDEAVEAYPPLAVLAGWVAVINGQTSAAQRWAAIIDDATFDLVPVDGSASFESARAMLRTVMCPGGPEQAMADSNLAMAQEPAWSPWRDAALSASGEAHLLVGDTERAEALFAEGADVAAGNQNTDTVALCEAELALLMMDDGRWTAAADHVRTAIDAIDEFRMHDSAICVLAFAAAARLAATPRRHRRDQRRAHQGHANAAVVHLRAAVPRCAAPPPPGQGVLGHRRPRHDASPPA